MAFVSEASISEKFVLHYKDDRARGRFRLPNIDSPLRPTSVWDEGSWFAAVRDHDKGLDACVDAIFRFEDSGPSKQATFGVTVGKPVTAEVVSSLPQEN